jgi:hypothetical protein
MTSAIYAITHLDTRTRYIRMSLQLERRWNAHRRKLRNGTHHCVALQRAWNAHGETTFFFHRLETFYETVTKAFLLQRETAWRQLFHPALFNPLKGRQDARLPVRERRSGTERRQLPGRTQRLGTHQQGSIFFRTTKSA